MRIYWYIYLIIYLFRSQSSKHMYPKIRELKPIHSCCKWGTQSFPLNSKGQNNWFFYSYILHAHVLCKHIQTKHSTKHTLVAPFLLDKIYRFFHEIMGTCAFLCTFNFLNFILFFLWGGKFIKKFISQNWKEIPP